MNPYQLRNAYILYIGAGAVATGGFIALGRAIPTIFGAFRGSMQTLRAQRGTAGSTAARRTERDLPMSFVLGGAGLLVLAIWLAPVLEINLVSAVLIMLFGFFFVTVSSRITGEIGSSSNPISGMTVATLLITCGLFVARGWTGVGYKAMALSTAALVCVAASNGGNTSQDLKTGYLVGSTPRSQQIAILVGVLSSAIAIGFVLEQLNRGATTHRAVSFPAYVAASSENVAELTDKTEKGPDGQFYRVLFVQADIAVSAATGVADASIARGKYLVDDSLHVAFLVDPGVCGTYPLRWEKPPADLGAVDVSKSAPELGPDRTAYRRVDIESASYLVDDAGAVAYVARPVAKFDAPKAQLFRLIIDGTLGGRLPWALVLVGVLLAIMMELVGVAALPFAVGLYLPISTSAAIFVGGLVRLLVDKKREGAGAEFSPGMLMASGLIAGGAITGVVQSVIETMPNVKQALDFSGAFPLASIHSWWPLVPFLMMAAALYFVGAGRTSSGGPPTGGA